QHTSFTSALTERRYNTPHTHRRSQSAATTHLIHIGAHRAPLQHTSYASALTERRYKAAK
ncbi:MAG: hypothetical protein WCP35_20130, partial [Verrucomicrobiota bacterium]